MVVSVLGLLALGGLAVAFWTAGGSGTGSGTTGSGSALTVNQTVSPTGLYPGGSSALSGNFTNPNSGSVYIAAVTATVTRVQRASRYDEAAVYTGGFLDQRDGHRRRPDSFGYGGGFMVRTLAQHDQRRDEPGQLQEHHGSHHATRRRDDLTPDAVGTTPLRALGRPTRRCMS